MTKIFNFINKHKYIILLVILYAVLFFQMQFVYYYGDDFEVLYPLNDNHSYVNILNFCLKKMSFFWNEWSGRLVGHFTVSFGLSLFGIQFFRILNPIMIFIMSYLFVKILSLLKRINFFQCLFFISLIIIGLNIYIAREVLYWAYGGILYMWAFNLTLLVVYFVYKSYLENKQLSMMKLILISISCLLQTFVLEQLSFMLISFLFIMFIISLKNKKKNLSITILLIISTIGFTISSLAPGNVLRTKPLIEELNGFSNLEILLGKTHSLFNIIFNPKLYGIYTTIFILLINRKYTNIIKNEKGIVKRIFPKIVMSYFLIVLVSNLFNLDLLFFHENSSSLYFTYMYIPASANGYSYIINKIVIIIVYYIILTISICYMFFKVMWKEQKFFFFALPITFIASIIPGIFINYTGLRYQIFFLLTIFMIYIYYLDEVKDQRIRIKELLLITIIFPLKYFFILTLLVLIGTFICKIIKQKQYNFVSLLFIILLVGNITCTTIGYIKNSKIYEKNEDIILNMDQYEIVYVDAIPYKDRLYSWHSMVTKSEKNTNYYRFYLDDFYESYYAVNTDNIYIQTEDGYVCSKVFCFYVH